MSMIYVTHWIRTGNYCNLFKLAISIRFRLLWLSAYPFPFFEIMVRWVLLIKPSLILGGGFSHNAQMKLIHKMACPTNRSVPSHFLLILFSFKNRSSRVLTSSSDSPSRMLTCGYPLSQLVTIFVYTDKNAGLPISCPSNRPNPTSIRSLEWVTGKPNSSATICAVCCARKSVLEKMAAIFFAFQAFRQTPGLVKTFLG